MTAEERLEALELAVAKSRKHLRLLITGAGIGLISTAALLLNGSRSDAAEANKEIRAASFILEDSKGKPRASLSREEDGVVLRMLYENGKVGAALCLHEDKTVLSISDHEGKPRAVLGLAKEMPLLCLYDEKAEARATIALLADGPHLILRDENGKSLPLR